MAFKSVLPQHADGYNSQSAEKSKEYWVMGRETSFMTLI